MTSESMRHNSLHRGSLRVGIKPSRSLVSVSGSRDAGESAELVG